MRSLDDLELRLLALHLASLAPVDSTTRDDLARRMELADRVLGDVAVFVEEAPGRDVGEALLALLQVPDLTPCDGGGSSRCSVGSTAGAGRRD